ncbi:PREDICTED: iron-sulfur cluster assembly 1 homolog, mitochondrial [Nipponia nippon]|uniref:iron-sulfur cluster assembly 1 homolog, mitochondrial n=1 Tax=Nipponia nippon TaxID=128390 RepID=UPI00051168AB|nr:PREDICTED: iron-sulfur cluster assembly 1 homolog, mitochondrial [Nipponia nippon]
MYVKKENIRTFTVVLFRTQSRRGDEVRKRCLCLDFVNTGLERSLASVLLAEPSFSASLLLTPSAVQKIKQLLKDKPEHVGVKVGVRTRGCNGLSYTLEYTKSKGDSDEEVVQDGVRVFIEKKAQLTLLGTEMDYVEDKLSSEFVFNNPNIKGTCGCGESFNI